MYFILSTTFMLFMSFGFSLIYGYFGTITFTELRFKSIVLQIAPEVSLVEVSLVFIIVGFLFKIGLFPCHF